MMDRMMRGLLQVKIINIPRAITKICLMIGLLCSCSAIASTIALVRRSGVEFEEVDRTTSEILGEDYRIERLILDKTIKYEDFIKFVKEVQPSLLLLMDNTAVDFGKKLTEEKDSKLASTPTISAMGLNLRERLKGRRTMSGVAYEVPAFTILTNFRNLLADRKLINVITIYRENEFSDMMIDAQKQLNREGINLIGLDASHVHGSELISFLNRHLKETYHGSIIDAILVMTDNILINKSTFTSVWLKKAKSLNIPLLCGVKNLTLSNVNLCSYAAFPDHDELGNQISQQVFSILEDNFLPVELGVEYILAVKQIANPKLLKKSNIKLKPEAQKILIKE